MVTNKQTNLKTQPVHGTENYSHLANRLTQSASLYNRGKGPLWSNSEQWSVREQRTVAQTGLLTLPLFVWGVGASHSDEDEEEEQGPKKLNEQLNLRGEEGLLNREPFYLSLLCNNPAEQKNTAGTITAPSQFHHLLATKQTMTHLKCPQAASLPNVST